MVKRSQWTGEAVKLMHLYRISQTQLADKLEVSREYVCRVLNGTECSKDAESRFMTALDEIIAEQESA